MKKLMKISLLLLAFLTFNMTSTFAQKYGHVNSGNLISVMPQTKTADNALKSFQENLITQGQKMAKDFEAEYLAFVKQYESGTVTPAVAQAKEQEFQKKQQEIQYFEQKVINDVAKKREELYRPILEKVQNAIDAVGKEGGYAMIFDTSVIANNPIVFASDSDDVLPQVKSKLGL